VTGHLTPDEQIDSLEGTLGPDGAAHLDVCGTCRDAVAGLRETFDAARRVDLPEPSPLFWQHQAARISALVVDEPMQRPRSAWMYAAWAGSAAAVVAAGLMFLRTASTPVPSSVAVGLQARDASPALSEPASRDDSDERAWSVVEDLGGEIDGDLAAAALTPATGAADRALEELDTEEQAELVRVLQRELKRKTG
jgi:hypothetical protein